MTEFDEVPVYSRWVAGDTVPVQFTVYDRSGRTRTARTLVSGEQYRLRAKPRATPSASFLLNVTLTAAANVVTGDARIDPDDLTSYGLPLEIELELVRVLTSGSADADTPSGKPELHVMRWLGTVYQATTP